MTRWSNDERDPVCSTREFEARTADYCWSHYVELIGAIRATAKRLGYAIGVHGSLARDIDLIAVPWVEDAEKPEKLVEALFNIVKAIDPVFTRLEERPAAQKPHGRRCWVIQLEGSYIDLSVMPLAAAE